MTTTFRPAPSPTGMDRQNGRTPRSTPPPRQPSDRRDAWMLFAVLFSGTALIAGIFAVGLGFRAIDQSRAGSTSTSATGQTASTATVHLKEFAVTPASVEIAAGGTLDVHNDGSATHNLAIEGTDLLTPMLKCGDGCRYGALYQGLSSEDAGYRRSGPPSHSAGRRHEAIRAHLLGREVGGGTRQGGRRLDLQRDGAGADPTSGAR